MIKAVGIVLILLSTSLLGYLTANEMQKHLEELEYLKQILLLLRGEIKYRKQPLAETFWHLAGRLRAPYGKWFSKMADALTKRSGSSFGEIWKKGIETDLSETKLKKEERSGLISFGNQLGYLDTEMQLNVIDLYREQLAMNVDHIQMDLGAKKRLCNCLGVMAGIFLAILLI